MDLDLDLDLIFQMDSNPNPRIRIHAALVRCRGKRVEASHKMVPEVIKDVDNRCGLVTSLINL